MTAPLLGDLFPLDSLTQLRERFLACTGFSLNIMDAKGRSVGNGGHMTPICRTVFDHAPQGKSRCLACTLRLHLDCLKNRHTRVTRCHAGFLAAAAPVIIFGATLGTVMVGPALSLQADKDQALIFARTNNLGPEEFWRAMLRLKPASIEELEHALRLAQFMVAQMGSGAWRVRNLDRDLAAHCAPPADPQENRYKRVFHNSREGMGISHEGILTEVNQSLAQLLGYNDSSDLLGKHILDLMPPTQADGTPTRAILERLRRSMANGTPSCVILPAKHAGGKILDVEVTLTPLDETPRSAVLLICRDVTQRIAAQAEAARQEHILRSTLNGIVESAMLLDANGNVLMANQSLARRLGCTVEELTGQNLFHRLPGSFAKTQRARLKEVFAQGKPVDYEDVHEDGTTCYYRVCPIRDNKTGKVTAAAALCMDVTEHRRAGAQLRKLTTAVEQAHSGVLIMNMEDKVEYANPHAAALLGLQRDKIVGRNPLEFIQLDESCETGTIRATIHSGRIWRGVLGHVFHDTTLWVNVTISPVKDEAGRLTHFVALMDDMTERKQLDDMLWNSLAEFDAIFNNTAMAIMHFKHGVLSKVNQRFTEIFGYERKDVAGLTPEFLFPSATNKGDPALIHDPKLKAGEMVKAEGAMRRKDGSLIWCSVYAKAVLPPDLNQGVILVLDDITDRRELETLREDVDRITRHDLKSPLNAIINMPRLIAEDPGLTDNSREMLSMIEEMGYHMLRQVNLSMEIFKIESGTFELRPEPVDLCGVLRRVARETTLKLERQCSRLAINIQGRPLADDDAFMVLGEETFYHTVFANLLENAVEASPKGEEVTVNVNRGRRAEITVHNHGVVPKDIRATFFDKYVTRGKTTGTGLGTYSAWLLVRAMNGEIRMRTSSRKGTTITVRLPMPQTAFLP